MFGDANLDMQFDSRDLVQVFVAAEYEDEIQGNSVWATGDWNADGEFTSRDLVFAFQDGGYVVDTARPVPEPSFSIVFLWPFVAGFRRASSSRRGQSNVASL